MRSAAEHGSRRRPLATPPGSAELRAWSTPPRQRVRHLATAGADGQTPRINLSLSDLAAAATPHAMRGAMGGVEGVIQAHQAAALVIEDGRRCPAEGPILPIGETDRHDGLLGFQVPCTDGGLSHELETIPIIDIHPHPRLRRMVHPRMVDTDAAAIHRRDGGAPAIPHPVSQGLMGHRDGASTGASRSPLVPFSATPCAAARRDTLRVHTVGSCRRGAGTSTARRTAARVWGSIRNVPAIWARSSSH